MKAICFRRNQPCPGVELCVCAWLWKERRMRFTNNTSPEEGTFPGCKTHSDAAHTHTHTCWHTHTHTHSDGRPADSNSTAVGVWKLIKKSWRDESFDLLKRLSGFLIIRWYFTDLTEVRDRLWSSILKGGRDLTIQEHISRLDSCLTLHRAFRKPKAPSAQPGSWKHCYFEQGGEALN